MAVVLFLLSFLSAPEHIDYDQIPDEDDLALQDEVRLLLAHPIDLNRAKADDLLAVPWLNPLLAYRIVAIRDSVGRFESVGQLKNVSGMTEEHYRLLAPVVRVARRSGPEWTGRLLGRAVNSRLHGSALDWAVFQRVAVRRGPWQANGVVEKDRGEGDWADWVGLGIRYAGPRIAVLAGDQSIGAGLGLVLSGPHRRAGTSFVVGTSSPSALRLAGSAQENRLLRGLGFEADLGGWRVAGVGSYAPRDARLNQDGTVAKLVLSGVHDDTVSQVARAQVREASAGAVLSRQISKLRVSASGCGVRYNRDFAPKDSTDSFAGSAIGAGGVGLEAVAGSYQLALEGAMSTAGGGAGAVEVNGDWPGITVSAGAFGYDRRYFAPLGRWRSLTDRKSRLEARAGITYRLAGMRFGLSGNTHRDYALDSLPARVEAMLGYEAGRPSFELKLGRSYRLERERLRTARLSLGYRFSRNNEVRVFLGDAHSGTGQGRIAAFALRGSIGRLRAGLCAGRVRISGTGVRMHVPEPGPVSTGFGFSTSNSAWRAGLGFGLRVARGISAGLRLGYTHKDVGAFDFGSEIELGFGS